MSIEKQIETILNDLLAPDSLTVRNDSHLHQGHASSPQTGDSHFTVTIAAKMFTGKTRVQRHQMVYAALQDLMNNPIHALAIHTDTPNEK